MYKTHLLPPEAIDAFPDEPADDDAGLIDKDFFEGLCWAEIEYMCRAVELDEFNRLLIALYCAGCSDKRISAGLQTYLPHLCTQTNIKEANIKERRHYIIRRINETLGESVGLITIMHNAFKGSRR